MVILKTAYRNCGKDFLSEIKDPARIPGYCRSLHRLRILIYKGENIRRPVRVCEKRRTAGGLPVIRNIVRIPAPIALNNAVNINRRQRICIYHPDFNPELSWRQHDIRSVPALRLKVTALRVVIPGKK